MYQPHEVGNASPDRDSCHNYNRTPVSGIRLNIWGEQGPTIVTIPHHSHNQERSERAEEDYPEWEMDNMDWNELEKLLLKEFIFEYIYICIYIYT